MDPRSLSLRASLAAILAASLASAAHAGPRDGGAWTNLVSDGGNPDQRFITTTASYTARYVHVFGTLQSMIPSTFGAEAVVRLGPTNNGARAQYVAVSTATTYTTLNIDLFVPIAPQPVNNLNPWQVLTFEDVDDGAGPDAKWNNLSVVLNDGPPADATTFGPLAAGNLTRTRPLVANAIHWYRFDLQSDVSSAAGTYLDIDTEGSSVAAGGGFNDTEIALYNSDGQVVGYDDDDGSGYLSQLSYGLGGRPAVLGSQPYDGRDGALPAGTYYLAVRGFGASNPIVGWDWPNAGSVQAGPITLNIRTNTGSSTFCPADFDKNGSTNVADIFKFLSAWFAGCP